MTQNDSLKVRIERFFAAGAAAVNDSGAMHSFLELREALEAGKIRAAEPDGEAPTGWRVNAWVKEGILLGFRLGVMREMGGDEFGFIDKHTFPMQRFTVDDGV